VLAVHPEGLPVGTIAALAGEDMTGQDRHRKCSDFSCSLLSLEKRGCIRRTGPRGKTLWFITPDGAERLAKGEFRAPPGSGRFKHGTNYGYHIARCRCDACRAWQHDYFQKWYPGSDAQKRSGEYSRQWREANPEKRDAAYTRNKKRLQAQNDKSRETAARHNQWWTGTELEIASREDLTAAQVAAMLGRTLRSVSEARARMRDDPRLRMLRDGEPLPTSTAPPRRVRVPFSSLPV
jgi:hypothetical protein